MVDEEDEGVVVAGSGEDGVELERELDDAERLGLAHIAVVSQHAEARGRDVCGVEGRGVWHGSGGEGACLEVLAKEIDGVGSGAGPVVEVEVVRGGRGGP